MKQAMASETVQRRVVIDLDRCVECGSCAAACYYGHATTVAVGFARSGVALLPLICRQCKAASCVDACPVEAMVLDEHGLVRRRLFRCIGCGSCVRACPFGVIPDQLAGTPVGSASPARMSGHQAAKCDLCADRTAGTGDGVVPRCVAACPSGALMFVAEADARELALDELGGRTAGEHPFKRR